VLLLIRSFSGGGRHGGVGSDWRLHPLIHTFGFWASAQDIESIKKRSRSSVVLSEKCPTK